MVVTKVQDTKDKDVILQMSGIDIQFPGVHALDNVDFTLRHGEIHSLMGENGAGKSTLIKVLTGVYKKDKGKIILNEKEINPSSPLEARNLGINSVYQEINLCDNLTVMENIYAGRQKTRFGKIDWNYIKKNAEEALQNINMSIDVTRLLGSYSVAVKQMIAIARAVDTHVAGMQMTLKKNEDMNAYYDQLESRANTVGLGSRILILDEPTSSLDRPEVEQLFSTVRKLRDQGLSVIFISHFLDQIYELCDRVTVLRNGKLVGQYVLKDLPKLDLVSRMVGKDFSTLKKRDKSVKNKESNKIFMEAKNFGKHRVVQPFDLRVRKGETLGFAGLLGSGRTESANLLFGVDEADSGDILIKENKKCNFRSPRDAIKEFIAFCPEDRKKYGIIPELSVRENIILAIQAKQGVSNFITRQKQKEIAEQYIKLLNIVTPSAEMPVGNLSGGNQQKVILARWLVTKPELLILDEPTRGIDVAAKAEIMNLAMRLCEEEMSLVFISSELEEIVRCCDRVQVMRDRNKITEISGTDVTEENILKAIAGGSRAAVGVA